MTQTELTPTASLSGKWKPYPDYKDSGVEWLGEIPKIDAREEITLQDDESL